METAEKGCQQVVIKVELDFNLTKDMLFDLPLLDALFGHLLYHAYEACILLLRHKHLAKRPLAQLLQ